MLVCDAFVLMACGQRFGGCGPSLGLPRCAERADLMDVNTSLKAVRTSQVKACCLFRGLATSVLHIRQRRENPFTEQDNSSRAVRCTDAEK